MNDSTFCSFPDEKYIYVVCAKLLCLSGIKFQFEFPIKIFTYDCEQIVLIKQPLISRELTLLKMKLLKSNY